MGRDKDGGPSGRRLLDQGVEEVPATGVEPGVGLVEQPEVGATVVLASHELERARSLAGRTVLVAGGQAVPDTTAPSPEAAGVA